MNSALAENKFDENNNVSENSQNIQQNKPFTQIDHFRRDLGVFLIILGFWILFFVISYYALHLGNANDIQFALLLIMIPGGIILTLGLFYVFTPRTLIISDSYIPYPIFYYYYHYYWSQIPNAPYYPTYNYQSYNNAPQAPVNNQQIQQKK
ncbi:MAG: hypothetical protein JSV49_06770 [Thermoplasmata archaeon]|nr:MAG: hypothetical protein JSV49_06770 [Thermoplasmata archaeon]